MTRLLPHLAAALAGAANPDRALINLERFLQAIPERGVLLAELAADPRALEMLVAIFAGLLQAGGIDLDTDSQTTLADSLVAISGAIGGLVALYDGRNRNETPLWLPEQRALVFADALTAPEGELLVWATWWHEEQVLPALRALLELPFEHVIVSHGEPVHTRAAYERALELAPWSG